MEQKKICIGIFDSNSSSRLLIKMLASKIAKKNIENILFLEASNGVTAIELVSTHKIDLCFINLRLSHISAEIVAENLRFECINSKIVSLDSGLEHDSIGNISIFDANIILDVMFNDSISHHVRNCMLGF